MMQSKIVPGNVDGSFERHTSVEGELRFKDTFRIDGRFTGRIVTSNVLIVGESGVVDADIEVGALAVMGRVSGRVRARQRVEVHSGARLEAHVVTPCLDLAEGAFFQGHCDTAPPAVRVEEPAELVPVARQQLSAG